ncbi:MAG: phenylalanine--tRNA ligase subunit beta [bacterium]|nr:phenylalanine--tRNA ligase subunit beta [bacterium]
MKYSYTWLKEISGTKLSPEKIAELLTMHSFELESVEKLGADLEGVVVGKIVDIKKHPNADRLQIVMVETRYASSLQKLQIVCGASNIKIGDKVPVALVGTKLPNGINIKETEIRGVKSHGMLCAEDELGLGADHGGIIILQKDARIGEKFSKILGLDDTIIELDVLSNRGHDALSHVGMAREIAALDNKKIDSYYQKLKLPTKKQTKKLSVKIQDKNLCPRYIGAIMTNIKVGESPEWMKKRLLSLGLNAINNIVDATNYVMLEVGQPMHAFDFNKLANIERMKSESARIIIRRAKDGEEIKLLDETIKKLSSEDLVIANEEKALALAGVMGGEDSGINENTTSIVLEAANFDATNVRKTRTRLNIKTDASDRFEKDIDPNLAETAMARIIEIIEKMGGRLDGIVDVYPKSVKSWKIKLDLNYVNKLLGEKISENIAIKILKSLEINVIKSSGHQVVCEIPTVRIDLKTQEDLIEEIGRIYGYEKIKSVAPLSIVQPAIVNEQRRFERTVKNILVGAGFSEVYNYSFYSQKDIESAKLSNEKHLKIENPMNPEQALLRVSLIPGILKNIKENLKYFKELEIFEVGRIYFPNNETLPNEKNMLVGAIVADESKKGNDFYEAKGYADLLLGKLGIQDYYFDEFKNQGEDFPEVWHKTRCAEINIEGSKETVGYVGEIDPAVLGSFGISKRAALFEIDLQKLQKISETEREFKPLSKFPTSTRDISMIAETDIKVDNILQIIQKSEKKMILDVDLFDIFDLEEEKKVSYAFHILFGADDRTLKNEEIDQIMQRITSNLEKELRIKVRR